MAEGAIWLRHLDFIKDVEKTAGGKVIHLLETGGDPGLDMHVLATSEQVVRWQGAIRAWQAAQAEMREMFDRAEAIESAAEQIVQEVEDADWDEQRRIDNAAKAMAEAEAEREHGPREWVLVIKGQHSDARHGVRETGRTYHHVDCQILARLHEKHEGFYSATRIINPVRLPDAVRDFTHPRWDSKPVKACKRCAGALTAAVEQA